MGGTPKPNQVEYAHRLGYAAMVLPFMKLYMGIILLTPASVLPPAAPSAIYIYIFHYSFPDRYHLALSNALYMFLLHAYPLSVSLSSDPLN